jgi:pyridoxamine 5'-phosphate oxidase
LGLCFCQHKKLTIPLSVLFSSKCTALAQAASDIRIFAAKYAFMAIDKKNIEDLRQDYRQASLSEKETAKNPFDQFSTWFSQAIESGIHEPNAMTLATSTSDGKPSARIVLLKGFDPNGFLFYTNYLSRKGREIAKNPNVALVFFWGMLERQVRIEGTIEKLDKAESEAYFRSRPRSSQAGAAASPQSQEIEDRNVLEAKWNEIEQHYAGKDIPKPSCWGGYRIKPRIFEFWQGGSSRLHDRIVYRKTDERSWKKLRLAP